MSYQAALFCQIFEQELRGGVGPYRARIKRVLRRLSPSSTGPTLDTYTDALEGTIVAGGTLRPDWRTRVIQEH